MRQARRRRNLQTIGMVLFLVLMMVLWAVVTRMPRRSPVITSDWKIDLMIEPSAPPVWTGDKDGVLLVPTDSGQLWAVEPQREGVAAGRSRPLLAAGFPLRAQPLVEGNAAYVPCEDGTLYAVDWRTGRPLWNYRSNAPMTTRPTAIRVEVPQPQAPPVVRVEAGSTASPNGTPPATTSPLKSQLIVVAGNDAGQVIALAAGTGRVLWQRPTGAPIGNGITTTRDGDGRPLILVPLLSGVASRGGLWCLDARNGAPLWKFPAPGQTFAAQLSPPAVEVTSVAQRAGKLGGGRVYCADDGGNVFCLDLKTGRYRNGKGWMAEAQPVSAATPHVMLRGEPLFKEYSWGSRLVVGGNDGGVRCFDARNGNLQWTFEAGDAVRCRPRTLRWGPPNAERDLLLIGQDGPAIYILDAHDGSLLWKLHTDGSAFAGPVPTGTSWLTVTGNGVLQSFSTPD